MKRTVLVLLAIVLSFSVFFTQDNSASNAQTTKSFNSLDDNLHRIAKSVDTDGNGVFNDDGVEINPGDVLCYEIEFEKLDNTDPVVHGFVQDTVPSGTSFFPGSTTPGVEYSLDGAIWNLGEPPVGSPAGTILRWQPTPSGWVGAGDSPYIGAIPSQPMDINVSRTTDGSFTNEDRFLALDSAGNPHIVWRERLSTDDEIFYVRWNGANWVTADGSVYDPLTGNANISNTLFESRSPSLALDSNDNPHIAWRELDPAITGGGYDITYIWHDGTDWLCADGSVYNPTTANSNVTDNGGMSQHPSLVLDSNNLPCIAWYDDDSATVNGSEYDVFFVRHNGTEWVNSDGSSYASNHAASNVSNNPGISAMARLALDPTDNPHITWHDTTAAITGGDFDVLYTRWNGSSWVCANGTTYSQTATAANVSNNSGTSNKHPAIEVDGNGNPHIAWFDNEPAAVGGAHDIFYVRWDGGNWLAADGSLYSSNHSLANVSRNTGDSYRPSLALDTLGNPNLCWYDDTSSIVVGGSWDILYVKWDGLQWVNADDEPYSPTSDVSNVSRDNGSSLLPCLTLDSFDNPHLLWERSATGNFEVNYVHHYPRIKTYRFCVRVDNPFDCDNDPIENRASFEQSITGTEILYSNAVSNPVSGCDDVVVEKYPHLTIKKTASSSVIFDDEFVTFKIKISNNGDAEATNVTITDSFPRELNFVTARPSGTIGKSRWIYSVGTLGAGQSRMFELKFKLSSDIILGEKPLIIENRAHVSCGELETIMDVAVISVRKRIAEKPLAIEVKWVGIDIRTSEGKAGEPITLKIKTDGGMSPYEVEVDWGDDAISELSEVTGENWESTEHTYNEPGKYTVVVTATDQVGRTARVERTLTIK